VSAGRQITGLAGFLILVGLAAMVGGWFTSTSVGTWYEQLDKPAFSPPDWVFGPVWTALYLAMAVAAWLVWRRQEGPKRVGLSLWGIQLVLNATWSALFFGLRAPGIALIELVALAVVIALTIAAFWRSSRPAAGLMAPYLAWVCFAGILNAAIWRLNLGA
jgi:tryptophan-rich sensory protein